MTPPSDADAVATAAAAERRPAHHPVAHAAAVPEQRRRWMDLLRLVLRYVGNGVGQVLRLMVRKNLGEPRDAGVVVADKLLQARDGAGLVVDELHNDKGPDAIKKSREERHEAGVVVNRDMAKESKRQRRIRRGNAVTNMNIDTRTAAKRNQAWQFQNRRRCAIPFAVCYNDEPRHHDDPASQVSNTATATDSPPTQASPLMVGDERVWGEELSLFAHYCEKSLNCGKNIILCHRCIFEPHKYYGRDKIPLSGILLHSVKEHTTPGFECKKCNVRVGTPREHLLHSYFCHELETGWWKLKLYKEKMKVMQTD